MCALLALFGLVPDHDEPLSAPCNGENVEIAPKSTILVLSGTILTACASNLYRRRSLSEYANIISFASTPRIPDSLLSLYLGLVFDSNPGFRGDVTVRPMNLC